MGRFLYTCYQILFVLFLIAVIFGFGLACYHYTDAVHYREFYKNRPLEKNNKPSSDDDPIPIMIPNGSGGFNIILM